MFIQLGASSGGKAIQDPITSCAIQGVAVTLRNSTLSSIKRLLAPDVNKLTTTLSLRFTNEFIPIDLRHLYLAVSVNALDKGDLVATDYGVSGAAPEWDGQGTASAIGLRLGVATNDLSEGSLGTSRAYFQQNSLNGDYIASTIRYESVSGDITVIGSSATILGVDTSSITVPIPVGTMAGDTVVLVAMSEINLRPPAGYTVDYIDRVPGTTSGLTLLQKNTKVSVYRKVVTSDDIVTGDVELSLRGGL